MNNSNKKCKTKQDPSAFKFSRQFLICLFFLCFAAGPFYAQSPCPTSLPGYTFKGTHNGHNYFLSNFALTGANANIAANATGGHLATIADAAENSFVSSAAGSQQAWIGFTDMAVEGTFEWVTGEPVTYTNWCPGEPNEYCCGGEDWTLINWCSGGRWNDQYNGPIYLFVVEIDDTDTDGDGYCDSAEECDKDPNKQDPGQCGCGNAETDSDCDGVADCNDVCPGGDDTVDNNFDGQPDCKYPPAYSAIIADWKCGNNKVYICHYPPGNPGNANTLCISYSALAAHIAHGDYLGPCGNASCDDPIKSNGGSHIIIGEGYNHSHDNGEVIHEELNFTILPNPTHGDFTLELNQIISDGSVHIYNSIGSEVWSRSISESTDHISVRSDDLSKTGFGVFHVVIKNADSKIVKSLLILE